MSVSVDHARRRRGHAHAVRPAQAAAHDLRPGDGAARDRRRSRELRPGAHRRRRRPRRRAGDQRGVQSWRRRGPTSTFVEQVDQRGTGDAAAVGMTALPGDDLDDDSTVVVLPGDTPLLRPDTLDELVAAHVANGNAATLLTSGARRSHRLRPGRCAAADGRVLRIVEQRDASRRRAGDRARSRTSIYAFRRDLLRPGAAPPLPRQRPGRVLPHRRRRVARRHGPPRRRACRRPPRRPRASTTAGSSRSPSASCAPAPTATGC